MLTFAYGSNMDWQQTRDRCPSAQFVCKATLKGHHLVFPRKSIKRNCGVASIEPDRDSLVWGVVYQIDEKDIGCLDRAEGYEPGRNENSYFRSERHVYVDGDDQKPLAVWLYIAVKQPNAPLPNMAYRNIIVDGAKFWHLPDEYISHLENIEVQS